MQRKAVPALPSASTFFAALAFAFAIHSTPASACINAFDMLIVAYKADGNEAGVAEEVAKLEADYGRDANLQHTNDLAVGRILTGRYADAVTLLIEAEKRFPGQAIVAANLGTAYELSGNDTEALRWIREGVRRDPKEHRGSEWLHVEILKAKIALARDPKWLMNHTVLGLDFGDADVPVMPAKMPKDGNGKRQTPQDIIRSISYQLDERTKFVAPPDPIIADLYETKGDLAYAAGPPKSPAEMVDPSWAYTRALEYGASRKDLVERRKKSFEATFDVDYWVDIAKRENAERQQTQYWPWIAALLATIVAGGAYFVRLRSLKKPML